jgi:hypothetical protein
MKQKKEFTDEKLSNEEENKKKNYQDSLDETEPSPPPKQNTQIFSVPNTGIQRNNQERYLNKSNTMTTLALQHTQIVPKQHRSNIEEQLKLVTFYKTAVHGFVATWISPKLKFVAGTDITWQYYST